MADFGASSEGQVVSNWAVIIPIELNKPAQPRAFELVERSFGETIDSHSKSDTDTVGGQM